MYTIKTMHVVKNFRISFSLKYLTQFTVATSLSDDVYLAITADNPITVEYHIDGFGILTFILAPKIDDEDVNH